MISCFTIAEIGFALHSQQPLEIAANFVPFQKQDTDSDFSVHAQWQDTLPEISGELMHQDFNYQIICRNGAYWHCYHNHNQPDKTDAVASFNCMERTGRVYYRVGEHSADWASKNWLAHGGFEQMLISKGRVMLHASLVESSFGGLLFSGPCGIGKSTQARLWENYEGCTTINGDRPIVGETDDGWMAYGSPYAGSSMCYVNRRVPVAAVIMLEQGTSCTVRRLNEAQAFCKLYGAMVVNGWNEDFVSRACDIAMKMAAEIPVYQYICTPDKNAVDTLKAVLEKEVK